MALVDPTTAELKDGRKIVIRCAQKRDASSLMETNSLIFLDGEGMIGEPDELGAKTKEEVRVWIKTHNDAPKDLLLIADASGAVVGCIGFRIAKPRRCAHWGTFLMGVRPEWRNCGVGNALLTRLLDWTLSAPEIEKVTLAVRADNPRAIALYKKNGFTVCGCEKDYLKLTDGSFVDDIRMERFVRT